MQRNDALTIGKLQNSSLHIHKDFIRVCSESNDVSTKKVYKPTYDIQQLHKTMQKVVS